MRREVGWVHLSEFKTNHLQGGSNHPSAQPEKTHEILVPTPSQETGCSQLGEYKGGDQLPGQAK